MNLDENEIEEFKNEAFELIEEAEKNLLEVEQGNPLKGRYDAIFRCFHSLKGAAGMLELELLRNHMHKLEDLFSSFKESSSLSQSETSFFLSGIDAARKLISGQSVSFNFNLLKDNQSTVLEKSQDIEPRQVDVFVIDDEIDLVDILGNYVAKNKYTWKGFTDPLKAVEAMKVQPPRIVISDFQMPNLDGLGVLRELRKISHTIPLIFVSAHLSKDTLVQAIGEGITGVIEKPFRENQVISQLSQALYESELNDLLNRTLEVLMFQLPDLEKILIGQGRKEIYNLLKQDVSALLTKRRQLRKSLKPQG